MIGKYYFYYSCVLFEGALTKHDRLQSTGHRFRQIYIGTRIISYDNLSVCLCVVRRQAEACRGGGGGCDVRYPRAAAAQFHPNKYTSRLANEKKWGERKKTTSEERNNPEISRVNNDNIVLGVFGFLFSLIVPKL